ncbi:MAG: response regulator transcription factor [Burkholderiaceae bacterium]|nr:response regulator transcription factor [Burkholderiaceae bacterium]
MRILVVEDEPTLRSQLTQMLVAHGYVVDALDNGVDALHAGIHESYDLIVLDLGLPQLDGISVLQRLRQAGRNTPVLILTARDNWQDKVAGIDAGADDYVGKPFHSEELLARVRALIRRSAGFSSSVLRCGALTLDTRSGRVMESDLPVTLTSHEYKVLAYLMHHMGEVVSRQDLTEHIYAQDFDRDSNTIDVFVARLRKKFSRPYIQTVRGLGYRLTDIDNDGN